MSPFPFLAVITSLILGSVTLQSQAEDIVLTNAWGRASILDSGPRATSLATRTSEPLSVASDQLIYTESTTLPAVSASSSTSGGASAAARASLSIEESDASGWYVSGRVSASTGAPNLDARAEIHLFFLLEPTSRAQIEVSNLTALASQFAAQGDFFSLQLHACDAAGTIAGGTLFQFNGNLVEQMNAGYSSNAAYYLLELAAFAQPGLAGSLEFSFTLDLAAPIVIPEPQTGTLIALASLSVLLGMRRR